MMDHFHSFKNSRKNFWILKILIYYESNNEIAAATNLTSHMSHNEILKSLAGVVNSLIEEGKIR